MRRPDQSILHFETSFSKCKIPSEFSQYEERRISGSQIFKVFRNDDNSLMNYLIIINILLLEHYVNNNFS